MNGFGGVFSNWPFYRIYWMAVTGLLVLLAFLLYPRGKEKSLKHRFRLSKGLVNPVFRLQATVLLVVAILAGSFIYYQNNILIYNPSSKTSEKMTAEMEKNIRSIKRCLSRE
ncbi:hypothetical protein [Niabella hibiscisoli]|uniref:hypothetical protein n=1 Tax=Niabella hibiscisoli TaxID=1825928 RepID=UPI001F0F8DD4|nr:hypothetical protein [Niabella hibiscisoli]MCH5715895.1 hypothetical protein [Niabella hibiscisoli]